MQEERTEGIVLRALAYKDNQRIITLFSPDYGLISLILKRISQKNTRLLTLSTPFTCAEYIYRRGNSDLYLFIDGTPLNENLSLRTSYQTLTTAGSLCQTILSSQFAGKPAPDLYALFKAFLKQVPTIPPTTLLTTFSLKLLKHEGLLPPTENAFLPHEWDLILSLANAQSFTHLRTRTLPPQLSQKIDTYFSRQLSQ